MNEHRQKSNNKLPLRGISPLIYISYLFNDFEKKNWLKSFDYICDLVIKLKKDWIILVIYLKIDEMNYLVMMILVMIQNEEISNNLSNNIICLQRKIIIDNEGNKYDIV